MEADFAEKIRKQLEDKASRKKDEETEMLRKLEQASKKLQAQAADQAFRKNEEDEADVKRKEAAFLRKCEEHYAERLREMIHAQELRKQAAGEKNAAQQLPELREAEDNAECVRKRHEAEAYVRAKKKEEEHREADRLRKIQEAEAQRKKDEDETEMLRKLKETEALKKMQTEAADQARKQIEAEEEAERLGKIQEAEELKKMQTEAADQARKQSEAEARKQKEAEEEAERLRKIQEAEALKKMQTEAADQARKQIEAEAFKKMQAEAADQEAERLRKIQEAEAYLKKMQAEAADQARKQKEAEEEAERLRKIQEAEALKKMQAEAADQEEAEGLRKLKEAEVSLMMKKLEELRRQRQELERLAMSPSPTEDKGSDFKEAALSPANLMGQRSGKEEADANAKDPMPQEDQDLILLGWGKTTQVKVEEQQPAMPAAKKDAPKAPATEEYNHRKASMALLRLRRNPNHLKELPESLRDLVENDDAGARKLLQQHGGNLDSMVQEAKHSIVKETQEVDKETTDQLTEFQVLQMYGPVKGAEVIREKTERGETVEDKNLKGNTLFLIANDKLEINNKTAKRHEWSSATGNQTDKNMASSSTKSAAAPSPTTPAPAEAAAVEVEPKPKPKNKAKQPKAMACTTPLERAESLSNEALKCKTEASKLSTQLKSLNYAKDLVTELNTFIVGFDELYVAIRKLIQAKVNEEAPYLPHVKKFVETQKSFQLAKTSATAMARGVKTKASAKKGAKKTTAGEQAA
ncbi:unnamed protein product [Symbiodinium sp. KB8]|nr:unnamed protein product [Symbiodinium sp. KB8]